MPHFNPFQSLFSPRRRLQKRNDISRPVSKGWGRRQWVIARSLCLYRTFILGDVPPAERANALSMRIQQWSPFAETGRYVVWEKETARVWIWDDAKRRISMAQAGIRAALIMPESVLRPRPEEDGLRLITCLEGVEVQIWKKGSLEACRWWEESPPENEWIKFLLANDLTPDTMTPDIQEIPWLKRPWAKSTAGKKRLGVRHERLLVAFGVMVFSFFFIWQGVTLWKWREAVKALETKVTMMTAEVEPRLAARMKAMENLAATEKLVSLAPYPPQIQVMASVASRIPQKQARLVEWQYNQGRLKFTLQGKNLDPRYYVKTYQEIDFFSDVVAEKGRSSDDLLMEMNLLTKGRKP